MTEDDIFAWTWQAKCTLMLLRFIESSSDPEEAFHQWMEEQTEGDWDLLEYAAKAWLDLRDANFLTREQIRRQCLSWLADYGGSRPL